MVIQIKELKNPNEGLVHIPTNIAFSTFMYLRTKNFRWET